MTKKYWCVEAAARHDTLQLTQQTFGANIRAATRNGQPGQLSRTEIFANMMAFTYCTRKVISRDCATSRLTSQYHFFN